MKNESGIKENILNLSRDRQRYIFDLSFYILGAFAFYDGLIVPVIAFLVLVFLYKFSSKYDSDIYSFYLDSYIDFLNQVNSGLSAGSSFESSVLQSHDDMEQTNSPYLKFVMSQLSNAIRLGLNGEILFEEIFKWYPIEECRLYVDMLKLSKETGASMNRITEAVLSNLYLKFKAVTEAKLLVYQKKLEQQILCIAPLMIIFFIRFTSGTFLKVLYTTFVGRGIMSISFLLLIIMKIFGRRIVTSIK